MRKNNFSHQGNPWISVARQSLFLIALSIIVALIFNSLRQNSLPLILSVSHSYKSDVSGDALVISLEEAKELYFSHSALFLDARPKEFYQLGHIAGAKNLPYENFDEFFQVVMKGVDKNTAIITYCDGEHCQLSRDLALALMDRGYNNVYVLENGWTVWKEANLPVESAENLRGN